MSNISKILILAIIGGGIGYITNVIAIKLIFRPINPIKIPIINKEIVGLIPKRKSEIAVNIGEVIQEEFLSADDIIKSVITEKDKEYIVDYIKIKVNLIIEGKMAFVPTPFKSIVQSFVSESIEGELKDSIDELSENIINKATNRINIQEIVQNKVEELDLYELESIILKIAKNELKHIEVLGFVLGFVIGIVQGIIVIFI